MLHKIERQLANPANQYKVIQNILATPTLKLPSKYIPGSPLPQLSSYTAVPFPRGIAPL